MRKGVETAPEKRTSHAGCSHHWVIESPSGPTSIGICKYCGTVKEFNNYLPYSSWEEDKTGPNKRSRFLGIGSGSITDGS